MSAPAIGSTRRVRRSVLVGRVRWTVELTPDGLELRPYRARHALLIPWGLAVAFAERRAGELAMVQSRKRRETAGVQ